MFFSWIVRTIPRSIRAFLALLVMLGSLSLLFSALQGLFVPSDAASRTTVIKLIVGLVIGLPATGVFYYFQTMDERKRHGHDRLEILNRYAESDKERRIYADSTAKPVFNSHDGAIEGEVQQPSKKPH